MISFIRFDTRRGTRMDIGVIELSLHRRILLRLLVDLTFRVIAIIARPPAFADAAKRQYPKSAPKSERIDFRE